MKSLGMIMIAEKLNKGEQTARQIFATNFNMRELCVKMVPKNLS